MAYYTEAGYEAAGPRFRRNPNPGPGVVQGIGKLGSLMQVLWYPASDVDRHRTSFERDSDNSSILHLSVRSRRGISLARHLVMASVPTGGFTREVNRVRRMSHLVTTSTYGDFIRKT